MTAGGGDEHWLWRQRSPVAAKAGGDSRRQWRFFFVQCSPTAVSSSSSEPMAKSRGGVSALWRAPHLSLPLSLLRFSFSTSIISNHRHLDLSITLLLPHIILYPHFQHQSAPSSSITQYISSLLHFSHHTSYFLFLFFQV